MRPNTTNSDPLVTASSGSDQELRKRFWRLALFNIASNLTVPLTGLVDTAMLGWLPEVKFLAGVALASLIFDYLYFGLGFLRMSTTGQTAQAEGGRTSSVPVLWRSLTIAIALSLLIVLCQRWIEHLAFSILSGENAVEQVGREYFRARIWGAPGAICQLAMVGWLLGKERSGGVLLVLSTANLTNIGLNWLFIVRLGLEAQGAGLASAIAQTVGALVAAVLIWRAIDTTPPSIASALRLQPLLELLRLNSQIFIRTLLLVTCFAAFTNASAQLGAVTLAANAILLRWVTLLSYLVDGVAYATETLAGRLWGARSPGQLAQLLRYAALIGSVLSAVVWIPIALAPSAIVSIFSIDPSVVDQAQTMAFWIVPIGVFGALAYVLDGFYLGVTEGGRLLSSMALSAGITYALLLIGLSNEENHVLWFSLTTLMATRTLTLGVGVRSLLRSVPAGRST